jgi:hypothetical protein
MADEPETATGAESTPGTEAETAATEAGSAPAEPVDETAPNQGATGNRPLGESPLGVGSETDAFAERPEAFVGAAFLGGLVLAQILRRFAR